MISTSDPDVSNGSNPYWFGRGCALGAIAGAVIALGLLVAFCITGDDEWSVLPPAATLGMPIGASAGMMDAALALGGVALIGRRGRALVWPAALVAGPVAAAIPLLITFHAGYPRSDGGIWIGLGLSASAFAAGAGLTPLALRPRR